MQTLTLAQADTLFDTFRSRANLSHVDFVRLAGALLAGAAFRLRGKPTDAPVIIAAGTGEAGAVGMAAALALQQAGVALRVVVAGLPTLLNATAAYYYDRLIAEGIEPWTLSQSASEMAESAPIPWLKAALVVDAICESTLTDDPNEDVADLIRLINSTRRPILAYDAPSGVGGDEGLIYSPCVTATVTLCLALPLQGVVAAWPVAGELWLANPAIPAALYAELGITPNDFHSETIALLGAARQFSPKADL